MGHGGAVVYVLCVGVRRHMLRSKGAAVDNARWGPAILSEPPPRYDKILPWERYRVSRS